MSLMTQIYIGVSGLRAQQIAINTTSHNLANIYTEGYVRQQVGMADNSYYRYGWSAVNTKQLGLGVVSAETRHLRDLLLDRAYRQESGRQSFYAARYEAAEEVEDIFGELEGVEFQNSVNDLWEAISEIAKDPDSVVSRAALVMNAEAFISRANNIYQELIDYQGKINQKVVDTVDRINKLADTIFELNRKISVVEAPDIETAADLRDQRDLALDELGSLVKITYEEDQFGYVNVRAEGQEFISKTNVWHMELAHLDSEQGSEYLSPVWPQLEGAAVFNLREELTSANNNDIGALKGYLIARGGYVADASDIPVKPVRADYPEGDDGTAAFRADLENYYNVEVVEYNKTVGGTVVMKAEALFDQLINTVVTLINDCLSPKTTLETAGGLTVTVPQGTCVYNLDDALRDVLLEGVENGSITVDRFGIIQNTDATVTVPGGKTLTILDMEKTSYGVDENQTPGTELFVRSDQKNRYTKVTASDGTEYYIYNKNDDFGDESTYTLGNLEINPLVLDNYAYIPLTTLEENVDMQKGEQILKAWDEAAVCLDPNNTTLKDINDYYSTMVGLIGNDGYMYNAIAESQSDVVVSLDEKRESKQGVTSEEELTNLIKFQNAYNASSRYITTVADMIDTLINRVGNW
ncbi:MAG: flagellar hook-associated protein FlgK [Lachnospiraceae bacterium]|nr:flagellar hook-associated protein FlgK [Lachnospiraceae bacterium]